MLLRAAGIPARLATGLGYGDSSGSTRTYAERNLHAWVEVSYAGVGWVASDPTLAAAQEQDRSLRERVAGLLQRLLNEVTSLSGGRLLLALALIGLLAAGLAGARLLRRTRGRRGPRGPRGSWGRHGRRPGPPPVDRPALAAFLRLDTRLGERGRRPHESLGEMRDRLDLPSDAVAAVEAECYAV